MSNWKIITSGSTKDLQTDYGFRVQYSPGLGFSDVENLITDYGVLDGGLIQGQRIPKREFSLVGWISGSSVTDLHTTRKNLANLFKPNRSASQEAIILQYHGSTCIIQASAFYQSGLGMGQSFSVYDEIDVNVSFEAPDPYLESPTSTSQSLAVTSTVSNINSIFQRDLTTGCWSSMASGVGGTVDTIITTTDGATMYVGGAFTTAGSNSVTACRVAKYTISTSTWASLSRGVGNDAADKVYALAMAPNGITLYAGGIFDRAGSTGTTACRIAQCNTSTCAWSSLGHANACVLAIAVDGDGTIYAGGGFSVIGGTSASYIAKRNPSSSAWSAMSVGASLGVTGFAVNRVEVSSIALGLDGGVYIAGDFKYAGGVLCNGVAKWLPSTGCWYALGNGFGTFSNGQHPRSLTIGPDGTLYAVGMFEEAGGLTASRAAYWNGQGWKKMGDGFDAVAHKANADNGGTVYAVGAFTKAGGLPTPDGLARWRGGSWQSAGIDLEGIVEVKAINVDTTFNNKLTFGSADTTNATASTAAVTVITNNGTADAYPVLTASGPGRIYEFRNFTTGDEIYFDIVLNQGEVATLDLRPGKKTFSSNFRGNIISKILPGGNVSTFRLLSGSNAISLFISGCTTSASAKLSWVPRYWGIDS